MTRNINRKKYLGSLVLITVALLWSAASVVAEEGSVSQPGSAVEPAIIAELETVPDEVEMREETLIMTWDAPTENTDGSPLVDLAGYGICINVGSSIPDTTPRNSVEASKVCTAVVVLNDATAVSAKHAIEIEVETAGTLYVRIAAFDTSDNASEWSEEATLEFDFVSPKRVLNIQLKQVK